MPLFPEAKNAAGFSIIRFFVNYRWYENRRSLNNPACLTRSQSFDSDKQSLDRQKSASFGNRNSSTRMLLVFKSLCRISNECKYFKLDAIL